MEKKKLECLDGLRGLMALNVVICHFVVVYYPEMYFQEFAEAASGSVLSLFAYTPLSILVNGNIAVQYFFVLTGFLVVRGFLAGKQPDRREMLVKICNRYFRLLPMVAGATLVTFLLMKTGLMHHREILDIVPNDTFLASYCGFEPTIRRLLLNGFYEPFVLNGSDFVGPFWTIRLELWGYILCMLSCYFFRDSKLRRLGYLVIAALLWISVDKNYLGFFLGAFVADLYYKQERDATVLSRFYQPVLSCKAATIFLYVIGLYLAASPMYFAGGVRTLC